MEEYVAVTKSATGQLMSQQTPLDNEKTLWKQLKEGARECGLGRCMRNQSVLRTMIYVVHSPLLSLYQAISRSSLKSSNHSSICRAGSGRSGYGRQTCQDNKN